MCLCERHKQLIGTSLSIRKMQIKTTMRYLLTPLEWPALRSLQMTNAGEDVEKRQLSCTACGNASWYSHYKKQYGDSSQN